MIQNFKIGDWVNSYTKGIHRIEKIFERYYDESDIEANEGKNIGDKYEDRIIVTKRFLNSKFKKSFSYDNCSEYFISHLDKDQHLQLHKIISQNPNLLAELDNYSIPVIESLYNMTLRISNKHEIEAVELLIKFIKEGKTFVEINEEMRRLEILHLVPINYGNYILQISNFEEECINKRKIYRSARLIKAG